MTGKASGVEVGRTANGGGEPERGAGKAGRLVPIGEAAERAGVSARTLRWYEELGLLVPSGHSSGGARRYDDDDVARIIHIRELQSLLGFDLGEIRDILRGEDDLAGLRLEYRSRADRARRHEILLEASVINDKLRSVVASKQERLEAMLAILEEKHQRYERLLAEQEADQEAPPEG
ncbi:MAG: MerR family transcriptional regulator [Actinomycetota bacterium]|jgi:DNA-binding transcriptional MerR regulator|nr:MerR family transcriptional regulator [Actinomycetota bacterium]MDA8293007.1 MerR family transcriptional regulator [Actinomycetota bacterium]